MASGPLSFATDIQPLFREIDVAHMKAAGFDLSKYDDVKARAQTIYQTVANGSMPPPPGPTWSTETCATFAAWIDQGCPP
jgi:hypothetical protein